MSRALTLFACGLISAGAAAQEGAPPGQPATIEEAIERSLEEIPAETVFFEASDGVKIAGLYRAPAALDVPRPAVLMLHGGNQRKEYYWFSGLVETLLDDGYHLLSIDIRGRGESEGGDIEALRQNPTLAHRDLVAALGWLRARDGVDADRIAVIGASYGGNLITSWMRMHDEPVRTIVTVSATAISFRFPELYPGAELHNIKSSGLYLACSDELARYDAAATAERLKTMTDGRSEVRIYEGTTHAIGVFIYHPESLAEIDRWLEQELGGAPLQKGG
ncbi:MAG: alpha/beta fold hydrolase [Planctomycetota bacterium]